MTEPPNKAGEPGNGPSTASTPNGGARDQRMDAVSASLRRAYSDAVAEDVPDALMDLLNKLR